MMTNAEATSKAYWEYVQTYAKDEFKDVHLIALNVHGPGMFHSANKPIKAIGDLQGHEGARPDAAGDQAARLRWARRRSACRCRASRTRSARA